MLMCPYSFQLLDELQKELEELRRYKIEAEKNKSLCSRNPSLSDSSNGYTLQAEMQKLRDVSKSWVDTAFTLCSRRSRQPRFRQP